MKETPFVPVSEDTKKACSTILATNHPKTYKQSGLWEEVDKSSGRSMWVVCKGAAKTQDSTDCEQEEGKWGSRSEGLS